MPKIRLNAEMAVAVAAMLTAVAATVVSVMQTNIMRDEAEMERQHARLSVQPSVWIFQNSNTDPAGASYSLELLNKGLGPAIIEQFEITLDGKVLLRWGEVINAVSDGAYRLHGDDRNVPGAGYSSVPPGHIIPAGESVRPIRLSNVDLELVRLLASSGSRPIYSACVCSVYRECWRTNGMGVRPEPVKVCVTDRERYFRGS